MITVTLPFESIEAAHAALGTLMVQQLQPISSPVPTEVGDTLLPAPVSSKAEATEPKPKKKRGRPRKIKILAIEEVEKLHTEFRAAATGSVGILKTKMLLNNFKKNDGSDCRSFTDLTSEQHAAFADQLRALVKEPSE